MNILNFKTKCLKQAKTLLIKLNNQRQLSIYKETLK